MMPTIEVIAPAVFVVGAMRAEVGVAGMKAFECGERGKRPSKAGIRKLVSVGRSGVWGTARRSLTSFATNPPLSAGSPGGYGDCGTLGDASV